MIVDWEDIPDRECSMLSLGVIMAVFDDLEILAS